MQHQKPFYFLHDSISLLVVEDDETIVDFIREILAPIPLYSIHKAHSAKEAENIITEPRRMHLCLLDLGIDDCRNDEFYLLKKFGASVSFVIFTGSSSVEKGFQAHEYGAKAVIEKGISLKRDAFIHTINHFALLNIINPRYDTAIKDSLTLATDVLFEHSPPLVSQWAQKMNMTDRTLRNVWTKNLGANAKIILATYHIFSAAFKFFEQCMVHGATGAAPATLELMERFQIHNYTYLEEFFFLHKSTICDFISFGNVSSIH